MKKQYEKPELTKHQPLRTVTLNEQWIEPYCPSAIYRDPGDWHC